MDIYVSDDPEAWGDPVAENVGGNLGGWSYWYFTAKQGRYVYFADIDTHDGSNNIMLYECDVQVTAIQSAQPYSFIM
jgi:hypothetical protein